MIKLSRARIWKYNFQLNASEDVDYLSDYLNGKKYAVLNKILYNYFVFERMTYFKILEYTFYEFIRVLSTFKRIHFKVIRPVCIVAAKFFIYTISIPFVGIEFYLKRRGRPPGDSEVSEFNEQFRKTENFCFKENY
jgi:hypothetical protein